MAAESGGTQTKEQKLISLALKRLKRCIDAEEHNRKGGVDDLKFLNGEQWDGPELQRRAVSNRPALRVNLLPKFVDQVVGDERHNRPTIKIKPRSSDADAHIAKIREGLIADIQYNSSADTIYDQSFEQMVGGRYGAWRVLPRWCPDNPWLQELYLERIPNPMLAYLDPDAKDLMGGDAKFGFLLEKIPREEFEERFKDAQVPGGGQGAGDMRTGPGTAYEHWYDKDTVTVAEYFVRKEVEYTICLMADGSTMKREEAEKSIKEWDEENEEQMAKAQAAVAMVGAIPDPEEEEGPPPPQGTPPTPGGAAPPPIMGGANPPAPPVPPMQGGGGMPMGGGGMPMQGGGPLGQGAPPPPMAPPPPPKPRPRIVKSRKSKCFEVRHYLITSEEVLDVGYGEGEGNEKYDKLEGHKIPGEYIPIVIVKGRERNIDGKTYIRSLITDAKDPQKLLNYWTTAAAEVVALSPKAPWLGTAKQFQGYENDYALANVENFPLLKYNPDEKAQGPPQRNFPMNPPVAIFTQISDAKENIKSVIGMFNADMGDNMPERTGAAVSLKQQPGDISTFAFIDNLTRAVVYTGKILNSMIPEVYDSERDVRLRGADDTETFSTINTTVKEVLDRAGGNPSRYSEVDVQKARKLVLARGERAKFNDISVGKYDVIATVGPSYATQRTESAEAMIRLATAMPKQMAIALDLIVKNLDIKDGEALVERLRKALPPGMVKTKPGEPPPQPMPPSPQAILMIEKVKTEQAKQQLQMMKIKESLLKILHEMKQGDEEVRKQVLNVLAELHAENHPADDLLPPEKGPGAPLRAFGGGGGTNLLTE